MRTGLSGRIQTRGFGVQEATSPGVIWNTFHLYLDSILLLVCELIKYKKSHFIPLFFLRAYKKNKLKLVVRSHRKKKGGG